MNEETTKVMELLQYKNNLAFILERCNNSTDLEREVRAYHHNVGIPDWEFEDDENEGIDWVCFNEIWEEIQ